MAKSQIDPFEQHEAMHMAEFLSRAVGAELCKHPTVKGNPALLAAAEKARDDLANLYQAIGNI